jgi:hypothetical protein
MSSYDAPLRLGGELDDWFTLDQVYCYLLSRAVPLVIIDASVPRRSARLIAVGVENSNLADVVAVALDLNHWCPIVALLSRGSQPLHARYD